jgi:hypothetical protein
MHYSLYLLFFHVPRNSTLVESTHDLIRNYHEVASIVNTEGPDSELINIGFILFKVAHAATFLSQLPQRQP